MFIFFRGSCPIGVLWKEVVIWMKEPEAETCACVWYLSPLTCDLTRCRSMKEPGDWSSPQSSVNGNITWQYYLLKTLSVLVLLSGLGEIILPLLKYSHIIILRIRPRQYWFVHNYVQDRLLVENLHSFLGDTKSAYEVNAALFRSDLNQLANTDGTWYERYATGCHPNPILSNLFKSFTT
jgi:hypothetical protein